MTIFELNLKLLSSTEVHKCHYQLTKSIKYTDTKEHQCLHSANRYIYQYTKNYKVYKKVNNIMNNKISENN